MAEEKKIYEALAYLIDNKTRSSKFYLEVTGKEYHIVSDGEIVIMLAYSRDYDEYEISSMNLGGAWLDLSLDQLMQTSGSKDYDLIWRYLKYFDITPDKIYELYANENFSYLPEYEADKADFDEN
jgi:hypothetical protein